MDDEMNETENAPTQDSGMGDQGGSQGGSYGGDRKMFKATCSDCGQECEV
ncbi:TPA: hypothetical protein HA244_01990, partial [Candidatus Micrarchaeota archaeon]|nr:hypothetical protein [Candidatus Micrarchaeota archaeon]